MIMITIGNSTHCSFLELIGNEIHCVSNNDSLANTNRANIVSLIQHLFLKFFHHVHCFYLVFGRILGHFHDLFLPFALLIAIHFLSYDILFQLFQLTRHAIAISIYCRYLQTPASA